MVSSTDCATDLQTLLERTLASSRPRTARPIPFIEQKIPSWNELANLLRLSADARQWANFGPVSRLLETALAHYLQLPPSRAVVMCSSGTAALFGLVSLKQYSARKRLRWVVSAYGFRATRIGPLADALVLDSDPAGMLDLNELAELKTNTYDGVVLTNIFGLRSDVGEYINFCRTHQKELVLDNAVILDGFCRSGLPVDEFISFHQTKPWGMGEGGCAIVDRESAPVLRGLLNFGVTLPPSAFPGACNGKISDCACALILQRLLHAPEWRPLYQAQARRLLAIALDVGFRPLAPMDVTTLAPAHLPLLADHPIPEWRLENDWCVMHKYYPPLSGSSPNARAIYDRIVNLPCHPDMAALSDAEIRSCLLRLASQPAEKARAVSP